MAIEIEVISKEMIKPSSPTPADLRRYNFSFLDQVTSDVYNPMVYFFSSGQNAGQIADHLKTSLSEVLTRFYPLAGRVNYTEFFIDCNDDGVPFLQTKVNAPLSDFIRTPFPSELNKLLPFELDELDDMSMGVQVNEFECGGVAVGICVSHKIGDALSFFTVVNGWAAFCRGEENALRPHFTSPELFPPRKAQLYNTRNSLFKERVARRYEIGASKVEEIRSKYASHAAMENQRSPSRVEALSAFLYGRFLAATNEGLHCSNDNGNSSGSDKTYLVCHAVNIRPRLDPPLPDYAFGNYYRTSFAVPSPEIRNDGYCHGLVTKVREEIAKVNAEMLKQFQATDDSIIERMKEKSTRFASGELITCTFTSLCRMPIYEADFGWGKPDWAGSPALVFKNLFVFFDKIDGDGIEVYVHLKEEHMKNLEADKEFLRYFESASSAGVSV